jgi:hypothetical protein
MTTRCPLLLGRSPAGWALALLVGVLLALLPLAARAAPFPELPSPGSLSAVAEPPAAAPALPLLTDLPRPLLGGLPATTDPPRVAPSAPAPAALLGTAPALQAVASQETDDQATLETQRPEVQWAAGDGDWQTVPSQQTVHAGDRVRTGTGAGARLVYFEGTTVELGPETGIRVERLARTENGNVVTRLFQAAGSTVSRVVRLVDPSAGFEIDTPSATAFVRGTMPHVVVAADGSTRVTNVPDGTEGLVVVIGKDQNTTQVTLRPGENTSVLPGLAPSLPGSAPSLALGGAEQAGPNLQEQQQQRHQEEQERAQQQAEQARLGLIAAQNELLRLTDQENALIRQIADILTPTPRPKGAGPSNDQFAGATPVQAVPAQFTQNTIGATTEGGEPTNPCGQIGKTVWFKLVAPAPGGVSVDTFGSSFDTMLAVYTGTSLADLVPVACNDDTNGRQSRVVFATTPGTSYYVQAGGSFGNSGNLVVNFRSAPPPPPNDLFARASAADTLPSTNTADTQSASTEPGEPMRPSCLVTGTIANTVWYTFTAPTTTPVSVDTFGSDFDTVLVVYTGSALSGLTQVRCNDDSNGTLQSRVSFVAAAGTTYRIQVGGFQGATGNLTVHFGPGVPIPPNDNFANAVPITTLPAQFSATTDSATTEPGEPTRFNCGGVMTTVDNTVWYSFTPTTTGYVALDTFLSDAGYDTVLAVYTGSAVNSLNPVVCNQDTDTPGGGGSIQSRVTFNAAAGTTYRIQVGGSQGTFGNLVLRAATAPPPPANDNFAAATVLSQPALPTTLTAATDSASTEPGEPVQFNCLGISATLANTVWYAFTPTTNATLVVDTVGSSFDTVAAVYTGGAVNALSQIACNDNGTAPARVVLPVTAGTSYRIQIGGSHGAFGSLTARFAFGAPPPANDLFANAQSISTLPTNVGPIDTTTAGVEPNEPTSLFQCTGRQIGATVWYSFTPATTVPVTVDTFGSNFDTMLQVYRGTDLSTFGNIANQVACNDDAGGTFQSQVSFLAVAGTSYRIQVGGFQGAFGNLVVHFQQAPPPPNDNLANATTVTGAGQFTLSTVAATTEPGEPLAVDNSCAPTTGGTMGATVWYAFTPTTAGNVTIDTFGSDYDTVLAVYTGPTVNALTRVACNDDAQGTQSQIVLPVVGGVTYLVQVGGFNGAVGNLVLNFSAIPGPGLPRLQPPTSAPPGPPKPSATPTPLPDKPNAPLKQRPAPVRR